MTRKKPWLYILIALLVSAAICACVLLVRSEIKRQVAETYSAAYAVGYEAGSEDSSEAAYEEGYKDAEAGKRSAADTRTVYVTPSGKKYHRHSCRTIRHSHTEKLEKWEAKEQGYTACLVCKP